MIAVAIILAALCLCVVAGIAAHEWWLLHHRKPGPPPEPEREREP